MRSTFGSLGCWGFCVPALLACTAAVAADDDVLEEVIVFARGEALIGRADAASEGAVGGADLSVRPLLRVAELLEAVPGLIRRPALRFGQGQPVLPARLQSRSRHRLHDPDRRCADEHAHAWPWPGVSRRHGLIPEVIDRIDYRKGTYRADIGDFSMAGSSFMTTIRDVTPSSRWKPATTAGSGLRAGPRSTSGKAS